MLELIEKRFIDCFEKDSYDDIGVEIEIQVINPGSGKIERSVCEKYLDSLSDLKFVPVTYTDDGTIHCVKNSDGDKVSFDSSYNILEFALHHSADILELKRRFEKLYRYAAEFFGDYGYFLTGIGINPYYPRSVSPPVNYYIFSAIDAFITAGGGDLNLFHHISSTQTHHDCKRDELHEIYNFLHKLDFINLYLFANAPDIAGGKITDLRDSMYCSSRFSKCGLTGTSDYSYETTDDLLNDYADRYVFFHSDNTVWKLIDPIPLKTYLTKYPDNADDFVSFKNVEITEYGTIEQRGISTQPISSAFIPVAFQKGMLLSYRIASDIIDEFMHTNNISLTNSQLRLSAATGKPLPGVLQKQLCTMLVKLTELAFNALNAVGHGEELLLEPLFLRAEKLSNPAKFLLSELSTETELETILRRYGDLDEKAF